MSIVSKGWNRSTEAQTSNPATLTKNFQVDLSIVVCSVYYTNANGARSGGAPTFNGVVMLPGVPYEENVGGAGVAIETWYLINASAVGGAGVIFSVPNTTNKSIYLSVIAYDSDLPVTLIKTAHNEGISTHTIDCVDTPTAGLHVINALFTPIDFIDYVSGGVEEFLISVAPDHDMLVFDDFQNIARVSKIYVTGVATFISSFLAFLEDIEQERPVSYLVTADNSSLPLIPSLLFYALDANNDDIVYRIQISDNNLFANPVVDAYSSADAGFVNTNDPGDTDPFLNGNEIMYTAQSPLISGTVYYWRVIAKDDLPLSGVWGEFTDIRTFTVQSGNITPIAFVDTEDNHEFITNKPEFLFHGVDGDGDRLTFEIQVANEPSFALPTLQKASSSDIGFLNLDVFSQVDPFNQNNQISYQVQSLDTLSDGQWYFRVRVKDVLVSAIWSPWSATTPFTINTEGDKWDNVNINDIRRISGIRVSDMSEISGNDILP